MKLSLESIIRLNVGLSQLDGYDKIVKQGETERVVRVYYKLTAGFRLAMAMNLDRLQPIVSAYNKARNNIILELSEGSGKVPDDKNAEFNSQDVDILDEIHTIKLTKIKENELDLDNNPIPVSTLALLKVLLPKQPEPEDTDVEE